MTSTATVRRPTTRGPAGRRCRFVCLAVVALVATAACGHRIDTDALVAANARSDEARASGGDARTGPSADEASSNDTVSTDAGATPLARQQAARRSGTTVPGGSTGGPSRRQPAPSAGCSTPGETGPIAIGSVGNYSGAAGSSLIQVPRTLQVWAQWVNERGGICGRDVQIIVVNDHSDPAQYRAALQDLVENRKVVAFSNGATLTGAAGVEYLESVKVPEVGGATSIEALWDSPMVFKTNSRPPDFYFGGARNVALFGPPSRKAALVTCREVAACGSAVRQELITRKGAEEAGVDLVYTAETSVAQPDYTAECRGAQASGAETVILMLDAASVRRFGQSCTRQGYNPVYGQISSTVTADTKDQPGLSDLLVATQSFPFNVGATPAQQEFQQAIARFANVEPGPGESTAWAGAKMLELGLVQAAQARRSITAATLVEALHRLQGETLGGLIAPVTYRPGQPGVYHRCWFAVKASGGEWTALNDSKPICRA